MDKGTEGRHVTAVGCRKLKNSSERSSSRFLGFRDVIYVKGLRVHLIHIISQIILGIVELIEEIRFLYYSYKFSSSFYKRK